MTKPERCAVDLLTKVNKSTLVNRKKFFLRQGECIMKIKPNQVKRKLYSSMREVVSQSRNFVKNPETDFLRNRKLPFEKVLTTVFAMSSQDTKCELMDVFDFDKETPTVSAFVQQRNKIKASAFETIFKNFTSSFSSQKLYKGYRLIAIDGSDLHTPTNEKETHSYYPSSIGRKSYNLMHLNALYDLNNKLYIDALVQSGLKNNEHKAFVTMIDRDSSRIPTIYIADRGYESYNNFAHVQEKGQFFLIRIKDVLSNNGIARGFNFPDCEEFDLSFDLNLTRTENIPKNETLGLKRISRNATFDYLPRLSNNHNVSNTYPLFLRFVRIKLSENKYELLATNLPSENFSSNSLKDLYAMRWGIETSFRSLKYTLGLIYFHSKKEENIIQEIFAKLTMYNFSELITLHVIVRSNKRKYPYQVNFSASVHICRYFFLKNISPTSVEALISKYVVPIRNSCSKPRIKNAKTSICFVYRVA